MRNNYKTQQKDLIYDVLKNMKTEFTIKDIYNSLNGKVGLTTIYRIVNDLVDKEVISKEIGKDNVTYYQYLSSCDKDNHFYLKCNNCGTLEHIDCDCISELSNHITKEHGFAVDKSHIIINGLCKKCK